MAHNGATPIRTLRDQRARPLRFTWFDYFGRRLTLWAEHTREQYGDSVSAAAPAVQKSDTTPETRAGRRRTGRP